MVDHSTRTVTSPSIRFVSSNSVRLTVWPLSALSITIALNLATACSSTDVPDAIKRDPRARTSVGSGRARHCPRHRPLDDRQVDGGRGDAEEDRSPPDHVIGAGALEQHPAEPDA